MNAFIIVRVRGNCETRQTVEDTLCQLHLNRKHNCTIVQDTPQMKGKIMSAKDYITWGPATPEAVALLLEKRGVLVGSKKLTQESVASLGTKFKTLPQLAEAIASGEIRLSAIKGLKPLFRLNPPRKGFGSIKTPMPKGALGSRKEILSLLKAMV